MTIRFPCPSCGASLSAPDEYQGKKANCKKCGERFVVPALVEPSAPVQPRVASEPVLEATVVKPPRPAEPAAAIAVTPEVIVPAVVAQPPRPKPQAVQESPQIVSRAALDAAFVGAIKKVPLGMGYKLSLMLVAFFMVLLPLVYIALIALVAYGAVQYAQSGTALFENSSGRQARGALLLYVGPLVIAAITVIFMIKPFFARMPKAAQPRSLTREEQPLLFDFVERICKTVGAPMPKRIDVDAEVNATASYRNGWLSLLQPNDLVLTIGMPLVKGLTARELGGVFAHEFGHFSQGLGMRMSYIIRSISMWFARVVYQRDRADEWLSGAASSIDIRVGIVLYAAMLVVWLTRRILWCLMMIGNVVSSMLLRQMEFDADSYEIQLAGSKSFASTFGKLQSLGLAYHQSMSEAQSFFVDGKLVDDLPRLVRLNQQMLSSEDLQKLAEHIQQHKGSWFDTHPSDKDRIAAGDLMNAPGVLDLDAPAEALFVNAEALSKSVTRDFFVNLFENQFNDSMLASVEELTSFKQDVKDAEEARQRMFSEAFSNPRAMHLGIPADRQQPAEQSVATLRQTKSQMDEALPHYTQLSKKFDEVDTRWLECHRAQAHLACGMKLKQDDWKNIVVGPKDFIEKTISDSQSELAQLHDQLLAFEQAFARRVDAALQWLYAVARDPHSHPAEHQQLVPLIDKAQGVLASLKSWDQVQRDYLELRNEFLVVYSVFAAANGNINDKHSAQINIHGSRLMSAIPKITGNFENVKYPFEHAQGEVTIAKFLLPSGAAPQDIGQAMELSSGMLGNLQSVYFRSIGTLAAIIEKVETAVGQSRRD